MEFFGLIVNIIALDNLIFEIKTGLNNLNNNINTIRDTAKLDARVSFLENKLKMKEGRLI